MGVGGGYTSKVMDSNIQLALNPRVAAAVGIFKLAASRYAGIMVMNILTASMRKEF